MYTMDNCAVETHIANCTVEMCGTIYLHIVLYSVYIYIRIYIISDGQILRTYIYIYIYIWFPLVPHWDVLSIAWKCSKYRFWVCSNYFFRTHT